MRKFNRIPKDFGLICIMSTQERQHQQEQIPSWHIKGDYVETCNCDFGCPSKVKETYQE
jgi:hypothetical protein